MPLRRLLIPVWLFVLGLALPAQQIPLGTPERVADGVLLYRLNDHELLDPPGPVAVQALRVDGRLMTLEIVRGPGAEPAPETVAALAAGRRGAIAAVNGGFFSLETGKPTDLLKVDGRVLHGSRRPRGAVGILERKGVTTLLFDRVVVDRRAGIPRYRPLLGTSPGDWAKAPHALSGAGVLMIEGREISDWSSENISEGFDTTRHPRTLIGTDADGAIWLVTVDGRNRLVSLGMNFAELQRLSRRLRLRSALNLDGGGSTTMWVNGTIVNQPSDRSGPRKVSEAIVVVPRKR